MRGRRLEAVDPDDWDDLLQRLGVTDVYYTRGYVEASALLAAASPVFLRLAGDGGDVVFPCLVRRDPPDVVSPYGYGGPLAAGEAAPVSEFAVAYEAWCRENGVVSSFVVFHPLFGNAGSEASSAFTRVPLAGTVAWPLEEPDLLATMHRHHRRIVRRAEADGLEATVSAPAEDLSGFVTLYEQTMRRAGAASFYLFGEDYWDALLERVRLVRVDVHGDGELLGSVLGMGEPPWLHYHLGATADAGRRAGASHLALLTLARWGQAHGYRRLHLGGGVGGREDSLLEFKLRFAPDGRVDSQLGKAVHDVPEYLRLSRADAVAWDGFFPAYRRGGAAS